MVESKSTDKSTPRASTDADGGGTPQVTEDPRGYVGTSPDDTPRSLYALPDPGQ